MAGTRLLIQSIVAVEMVVLSMSGLWFGVCYQNDVLCLPLKPKSHRARLDQSLEDFPDFSPSESKRKQVKLTLYLEDSSLDWKKWSDALNVWVDEVGFARWPCWKHFTTDIRLKGPIKSSPTGNKTSITRRQIQQLGSRLEGSDVVEMILYVSKSKMVLGHSRLDQSTSAINVNSKQLVMMTSEGESIAETMLVAVQFLKTHGIDLTSNDVWKQVATSTFSHAKQELILVRDQLNSMGPDIDITEEIVERWVQSFNALQSFSTKETHEWVAHLSDLDRIIDDIEALRNDTGLVVPLSFPIEHLLATFAPLLVPLLLPILFGLKREYGRYKTKKKEAEVKRTNEPSE